MKNLLFYFLDIVLILVVASTLVYNIFYQKEVNKAKDEINVLLPTSVEVIINVGFLLAIILLFVLLLSLAVGFLMPQLIF